MPKVTAEHRESRRHEIAAAALRVFARKGFQATSMAEIISESGLSAGAIYGHYKSKDELVQAAITDLLEFRLTALGVTVDGAVPAPGDMLRRFVRGIEAEIVDLSLLLQVWAQAALEPSTRAATDRIGSHLRAGFERYLLAWYTEGLRMPAADAETAAHLFAPTYLALLQGYVIQNAILETFDRDSFFAAASAIRPAPAL